MGWLLEVPVLSCSIFCTNARGLGGLALALRVVLGVKVPLININAECGWLPTIVVITDTTL